MVKFTLSITLGNDGMATPGDVADALEKTAERLRAPGEGIGNRDGKILDTNGNSVGDFKLEVHASPEVAETVLGTRVVPFTKYIQAASLVQQLTLAMQAAWIEWKHGRGSEAALGWIENTLDGPDTIPEIETTGTDAQAFYDREIKLERERVAAFTS